MAATRRAKRARTATTARPTTRVDQAEKRVARLTSRLPGFVLPDSSSQLEGHLDRGMYVVEEYRRNFPNADTDYARVQAPGLGANDTWICTRWKTQQYAIVEAAPAAATEPLPLDSEPQAVAEQTLVDLLPQFRDFTYDFDEARYPYPLPGVTVPQAPPGTNNCCTFVEALLVRAWSEVPGFTWSPERHRQMMIASTDDYFSPVTAAVESGMAQAVADADAAPHPWTVVQGWRHQWRNGHTFLIVDHHQPTDRVLTLESNSSYKLNGVGFRQIGNLRDVGGRPPEQWWEQADLWTWERIRSTYRFHHQAALKVRDRSWAGA